MCGPSSSARSVLCAILLCWIHWFLKKGNGIVRTYVVNHSKIELRTKKSIGKEDLV